MIKYCYSEKGLRDLFLLKVIKRPMNFLVFDENVMKYLYES